MISKEIRSRRDELQLQARVNPVVDPQFSQSAVMSCVRRAAQLGRAILSCNSSNMLSEK